MKFILKREVREVWSPERIQAQMDCVSEEIKIFASQINKINSTVSGLIEERMIVQRKIGNKQTYINQLKKQLKEKLNSEQNAQESDTTNDK